VHGRHATFVPGFGVTIAAAVKASRSAYPFFRRAIVTTDEGDRVELMEDGYCANNPTLYAIAALERDPILSRPKYDIAVRELEVHPDREEPLEFRTASQNHIAVELLPSVPAYMKWPVTQATATVSPQRSRERCTTG